MKQIRLILSAIFLSLVITAAGCSSGDAEPPAPAENLKLFSPDAVCSYPSNVTGKAFHPLGGGTWSPVDGDTAGAEYNCSGASNAVQIYTQTSTAVNVEYNAVGTKQGPRTITIRYSALDIGQNESTYRNVFANFSGEILKQAFNEPMPELMRKKIMNLASYFKAGKGEEEMFPIGDGFANLTRENDAETSSISVTLNIFPDKNLKLR